MTDEVVARVRRVVAQVLNLPEGSVGLETEQASTVAWDSLHHIHLITALEEEFRLSIDADDLLELTSVRAIVAYVAGHR